MMPGRSRAGTVKLSKLGGLAPGRQAARMSSPAAKSPHAGHRFPAEVISQAVWLYFRFPLSLRMVEEMLAARGIVVSHETIRQWALKFGQEFANQIRRRLPRAGDKWHLDEAVIKIAGVKH
jgi:putative transposase